MAIEGPIRELGVSDLLQLLGLSRRTGRLTARRGDTGESLTIDLNDGRVTGVVGLPSELRIGRLAVLRERATVDEVARGVERQASAPIRLLGEILVEMGALDPLGAKRLIEFQIGEAIFDLLRWEDGFLAFHEGGAIARGAIQVRLSIDSLLLEAARRIDELEELLGGVRAADATPSLVGPGEGGSSVLSMEPLEWAVLAEVDGARTLRGISRSLGLGELEVARALRTLMTEGIVELSGAIAALNDPLRPNADELLAGIDRSLATPERE